jgi:hypothetical protein
LRSKNNNKKEYSSHDPHLVLYSSASSSQKGTWIAKELQKIRRSIGGDRREIVSRGHPIDYSTKVGNLNEMVI